MQQHIPSTTCLLALKPLFCLRHLHANALPFVRKALGGSEHTPRHCYSMAQYVSPTTSTPREPVAGSDSLATVVSLQHRNHALLEQNV